MAKLYDHWGIKGDQTSVEDNLANDLIKIVDTSKDRTTLLTNLVMYVQKREAKVHNHAYKLGKGKV